MMLWLIYISLFMVIAAAFPFISKLFLKKKKMRTSDKFYSNENVLRPEGLSLTWQYVAIVDGDKRKNGGQFEHIFFSGLLFWLSRERERDHQCALLCQKCTAVI